MFRNFDLLIVVSVFVISLGVNFVWLVIEIVIFVVRVGIIKLNVVFLLIFENVVVSVLYELELGFEVLILKVKLIVIKILLVMINGNI